MNNPPGPPHPLSPDADSWKNGAEAYAEGVAPDATYIIANGKVQGGWPEIVDGHKIIFSAWARNNRLEDRINSTTFLTPDVAQLVGYGHIVYKDHRSSEQNWRTVYTSTTRREPDEWTFVSEQNAPLGVHRPPYRLRTTAPSGTTATMRHRSPRHTRDVRTKASAKGCGCAKTQPAADRPSR